MINRRKIHFGFLIAAFSLIVCPVPAFGQTPADPTKKAKRHVGFGAQSWRTAEKFPSEFVKEHWDKGYHITSVSHGGGLWAVVMSKQSGYDWQYWKTSYTFPAEFVKEHWNEGRSITSVAYGDGLWAVVMSKGAPYESQTYSTSATFPEAFVKEHWDSGHHITSVGYGNGLWAVVVSTDSGFCLQSWKTSREFPNEWVKENWSKGYDITCTAYGEKLWAVVMSKQLRDDPNPKGFLGVAVVDAQERELGALVNGIVADSPAAIAGIQNGDVIVEVGGIRTFDSTEMLDRVAAFPAGQTVPVRVVRDGESRELRVRLGSRTATIERQYGSQHWQTRHHFPLEFVKERWDDGHSITSVANGDGLWAVVMSKEDLPLLPEVPKLPVTLFPDVEP